MAGRRGKCPAVGITIDYIKRGESRVETGYAYILIAEGKIRT
jgi:hypothetical protein